MQNADLVRVSGGERGGRERKVRQNVPKWGFWVRKGAADMAGTGFRTRKGAAGVAGMGSRMRKGAADVAGMGFRMRKGAAGMAGMGFRRGKEDGMEERGCGFSTSWGAMVQIAVVETIFPV